MRLKRGDFLISFVYGSSLVKFWNGFWVRVQTKYNMHKKKCNIHKMKYLVFTYTCKVSISIKNTLVTLYLKVSTKE